MTILFLWPLSHDSITCRHFHDDTSWKSLKKNLYWRTHILSFLTPFGLFSTMLEMYLRHMLVLYIASHVHMWVSLRKLTYTSKKLIFRVLLGIFRLWCLLESLSEHRDLSNGVEMRSNRVTKLWIWVLQVRCFFSDFQWLFMKCRHGSVDMQQKHVKVVTGRDVSF